MRPCALRSGCSRQANCGDHGYPGGAEGENDSDHHGAQRQGESTSAYRLDVKDLHMLPHHSVMEHLPLYVVKIGGQVCCRLETELGECVKLTEGGEGIR